MSHAWSVQPAIARPVEIRRIGMGDLGDALRQGWADFLATPTQLVFLTIFYPVFGLVLGAATAGGELWSLLWPLVGGFALVGPVAALGIYELSRRREQGKDPSVLDAFCVFRSPALSSILALAVLLLAIFVAWIAAARGIYNAAMGHLPPPASLGEFAERVTSTSEGLHMFLLGNGVGLAFAAVVLCLTVVSFPMLLDRNPGVAEAVRTSVRAVAANPLPMAAWGLLVAGILFLGSLPLFVGLAIALPVLGHATWHLYRKVVAPPA